MGRRPTCLELSCLPEAGEFPGMQFRLVPAGCVLSSLPPAFTVWSLHGLSVLKYYSLCVGTAYAKDTHAALEGLPRTAPGRTCVLTDFTFMRK